MNEIADGINPSKPPIEILNTIKALSSEHFDNYLLVFMKDGVEWHAYNNKISGFGMASMICSEIGHTWFQNNIEGPLK